MAARRTTTGCSAVALIALSLAAVLVVVPLPTVAAAGQLPASPQPFPAPAPSKPSKDTGPLGLFPLQPQWTIALNNGLTAPPAFDAPRAFFPIDGDRIVAYDLSSGKQLWIASVRTATEPTAGGGLLFVVLPDSITALRGADGSVAWQLPFAEPLATPPVWDTGWLIVATKSGSIVALRADDGSVLWRHELQSPAAARPALADDRVYVPLADGRVVALALEGGAPVWERKLGGAATDVLPLGDRLFVGSTDNFFYCLKTRDGSPEWRWRTGADVLGVPAVDERNVYFVSLDNVLRALRRTNGVQQWKSVLALRPTSGPLKAGNTLIVTGLSLTLRGFSAKDGASAGELALPAELAAPPHLLQPAGSSFPSLVVCTQDLAKGATVSAYTRSIEPAAAPLAPLPNAIVPPPTLPPAATPTPSR